MTQSVKTKLKIVSWDEKPYQEFEDGRKLSRAHVVLASEGEGSVQLQATWDAVLAYAADGTGSYVGIMHAAGSVDGREGSFIQQGSGTYDGTQAVVESFVLTGFGTGDLAGLSGTSESVSTHADYPYWPMTFTYELE